MCASRTVRRAPYRTAVVVANFLVAQRLLFTVSGEQQEMNDPGELRCSWHHATSAG
jgi:hypothetical protein